MHSDLYEILYNSNQTTFWIKHWLFKMIPIIAFLDGILHPSILHAFQSNIFSITFTFKKLTTYIGISKEQCHFAKILVFTVCLWFFDMSFGGFYNFCWSSSLISVITEKPIMRAKNTAAFLLTALETNLTLTLVQMLKLGALL